MKNSYDISDKIQKYVKKSKNKALSILLVATMIVSISPEMISYAATVLNDSSLCKHHKNHTELCGYNDEGKSCEFKCPICNKDNYYTIDPNIKISYPNNDIMKDKQSIDALKDVVVKDTTSNEEKSNYSVSVFSVVDNETGKDVDFSTGSIVVEEGHEYSVIYVAYKNETNDESNGIVAAEMRTINVGSENQVAEDSEAGQDVDNGEIVEGMTPSSSVVNLFDYSVCDHKKDANGACLPEGNFPGGDINHQNEDPKDNKYKEKGINSFSKFKFESWGHPEEDAMNNWNAGESGLRHGKTVKNLLNNGYPELVNNPAIAGEVGEERSLNYIFDPENEEVSEIYRKSYKNVKGLFQINEKGNYYYDAGKNFAEFDGKDKFKLYDEPRIDEHGNRSKRGQFFPFNKYKECQNEEGTEIEGDDSKNNHYFGMTLTAKFNQKYDGHTSMNKSQPMKFDFKGDDDVWVFIDDVLVADLGGLHDEMGFSIDFSTGEIKYNLIDKGSNEEKPMTTVEESYQSIYKRFEKAGKVDSVKWQDKGGKKIFANNTYHTIKFFYLERGNYDSHLSLEYNLTEVPPTKLKKLDQYGNTMKGVDFGVYKCSDNWEIKNTTPVYSGTTDANGEITFIDKDGLYYTIDEIKRSFGEKFIIKEESLPEGYRQIDEDNEIRMKVVNNILVCEDSTQNGITTNANLKVNAPSTIVKAGTNEKVTYYEQKENNVTINPKGTLFAVPLKYIGTRDEKGKIAEEDIVKTENWAPIYGNFKDGFEVVDETPTNKKDFVKRAIEAASKDGFKNIFKPNNNIWQMDLLMEELPGDISKYYYMLEEKSKAEYTVGYYWSEADNIQDIKPENTYFINANDKDYAFERAFGATIEVSNIKNRIIMQKTDQNGNFVNGARFALYPVEVEKKKKSDEKIEEEYYYKISEDNKRAYLGDYDAKNKQGKATIDGKEGTYTIDSEGNIEITIDGTKKTILPYKTVVTKDADTGQGYTENGTVIFEDISKGKYIVREVDAPKGYEINPTEIKVLVDDTSIFANAGEDNDGVSVGRGPGYLLPVPEAYTSSGRIDNTLYWMYEQLGIKDQNGEDSFASVYEGTWEYLVSHSGRGFEQNTQTTTNQADGKGIHIRYTTSDKSVGLSNYELNKVDDNHNKTISDDIRMFTSRGWSDYLLYQDTDLIIGKDGTINQDLNKNASYTNLRDINLSNIVSQSVFVRVADKSTDNPPDPIDPPDPDKPPVDPTDPPDPDKPPVDPTDPPDPDKPPVDPTDPPDPDKPPVDPTDPDRPGESNNPNKPSKPDNSSETPNEPSESGLPQTGQQWTVVLVLLIVGVAVVLMGIFKKRKEDIKNEK